MPRTLGQAAGFLLGLWIALCLSPLTVRVSRAENHDAPRFATLEASLHESVNAVRSDWHLIPLKRLTELDRVARDHSLDMARRNYLAHLSPEGVNPVDRLHGGGVTGFSLAAENAGMTSRGDPNASGRTRSSTFSAKAAWAWSISPSRRNRSAAG